MTTIDIEDTVKFNRPSVDEERTRILSAYANKDLLRRPDAEPPAEDLTRPAERAFAYVPHTTGELPLVIAPEDRQAVIAAITEPVTLLPVVEPSTYVGRHRARKDAEPIFADAPTALWPRLIGRLLRRKAGVR